MISQTQPQGKSLILFRYAFSTFAIIYRIAVVASIARFIQDDQLNFAIPLICNQVVMIGISIFSIITSYQSENFRCTIFQELVYLIPSMKKNTQRLEWIHNFSLLSKVYGHFLEALFFMVVIIFSRETSINDQVVQMLNFILLVFLIETFQNRQRLSIPELSLNILLRFFARSLFLGQFLLCHRSIYFFVFDLIVVVLFISFSGIEELQQNAFTVGYKFDEPKEKLSSSFPENLILPQLSFGIHFIRQAKSEDEELDVEKENLFSGIQVIHVLAMILFDYIFNNWEQNTIFRGILHTYLLILSYQFIKSLIWLIKFFMFGPIVRTIIIDCEQLTYLNNEEVQKQYFRFKPLQKIINLKFQNYNKYQFERIISLLMDTNKQFNVYMKCDNFEDEFVTLQSENVIKLQIQNFEFVKTIVQLVVEKQYYKLPFEINVSNQINQFQEKFLLNEFVQNYEIIPSITPSSDENSSITHVKSVVLHSLAFKKHIQNELNFMPQQIFYDIYDD